MTTQHAGPGLFLLEIPDAHPKASRDPGTITIGMTRQDKRASIKAESERLVIAYPDLLDLMAAAAHRRARALAESHIATAPADSEEGPHNMAREAYWDMAKPSSPEFYSLSNAISDCCGIDAPTWAQLRTVFFMLPNELVLTGFRWGFDDCHVRGALWHFVETNAKAVFDALQAPP